MAMAMLFKVGDACPNRPQHGNPWDSVLLHFVGPVIRRPNHEYKYYEQAG